MKPGVIMIHNLLREDAGQDLVEYAFLLAWVALVAVVAVRVLGTGLNTMFTNLNANLSSGS
jgi:Flp pilus assembly pilin Flp